MKSALLTAYQTACAEIKHVKTIVDLKAWKSKFTNKHSVLSKVLSSLKNINLEERKVLSSQANNIKKQLLKLYQSTTLVIQEKNRQNSASLIDPTLPSFQKPRGSLHPTTKIETQIKSIMKTLNFTYSSAPLVETAAINFQMLGVGKNHPARSVSDTFYVNAEHHSLLRTHSTNHTIHKLKAIAEKNHICQGEHAGYTIGPVFRRDDDDATHSHQFYQMDAFLVGRNASMGELKSLLTIILNQIFTKTIKIRFRSSYFPFTSPSLEVDVECQNNHNDDAKKCSMCKNSGFIEILGGGMINPLVFKKCGFQNWRKIKGYAFGMGLERIAMIKYRIKDIRIL